MFSSTTILSSTSTPMDVVRAISVRLFRLSPDSHMTIIAISSEIGMASTTMAVERTLWRKKNSTRPAMIPANTSSSPTPRTV